jgi:hypothetical protein
MSEQFYGGLVTGLVMAPLVPLLARAGAATARVVIRALRRRAASR